MTNIQNTHRFQGFKLTFADWLKFSLIEELTYEIGIRFQENFPTNNALNFSPARTYMFGHCFKAVTVPIYYLFVVSDIILSHSLFAFGKKRLSYEKYCKQSLCVRYYSNSVGGTE
jgi:hypothetical protein